LTHEIFNFLKISKIVDRERECVWRISDNTDFSIDCKLYHKIFINRLVECFGRKDFEAAHFIDFVHLDLRSFIRNQVSWSISAYVTLFYIAHGFSHHVRRKRKVNIYEYVMSLAKHYNGIKSSNLIAIVTIVVAEQHT
jgi:hypothetical protein